MIKINGKIVKTRIQESRLNENYKKDQIESIIEPKTKYEYQVKFVNGSNGKDTKWMQLNYNQLIKMQAIFNDLQESKKLAKVIPHKKLKESLVNDEDWDRVENIKEMLGADEFIDAIFKQMSNDEAVETLDYIERMYDIGYDEENDE